MHQEHRCKFIPLQFVADIRLRVHHTNRSQLLDKLDTRRINHQVAFKDEGVCTNQAESYFSRLRRAEIGTQHHIAGPPLNAYANEMAWYEDNRREANGSQFAMVIDAAMASGVSRQWNGYWQRAA